MDLARKLARDVGNAKQVRDVESGHSTTAAKTVFLEITPQMLKRSGLDKRYHTLFKRDWDKVSLEFLLYDTS